VTALVWVNGRRQRRTERGVSPLDRGFTLGDGVFETLRLYAGAAFRLEAHLRRLARGASVLGLEVPASLGPDIARAVAAATREGVGDAALRVTLTRGIGAPGLAPPAVAHPTLVVAIHSLDAPTPWPERAITARIVSVRRNEHSPLSSCKTLAFTDSVVALAEARAAGAEDAILLDAAGHVSEGSASNVFVVSDDTLVTPPESCGILPGITRAAVLDVAASRGIAIEVRALEPEELLLAREVFLTSTLREITPVVRVDGTRIASGEPGPVTAACAEGFARLRG
jgi:branched-chain amino acid aminotransferase